MARPRRLKSERYEASFLDEPATRTCSVCRQDLPKEQFARCRKHGRQRRCRTCHAASMRAHRAQRPGAETERYRDDAEYRKKVKARSRVGMRERRGSLPKESCEICGDPAAQKHHDDYDRPLDVRWLCVKCHGAEHYPDVAKGWGHSGKEWCSGHQEFLPVQEFAPGESYCRACRADYARDYNRRRREDVATRMARLAEKYANR